MSDTRGILHHILNARQLLTGWLFQIRRGSPARSAIDNASITIINTVCEQYVRKLSLPDSRSGKLVNLAQPDLRIHIAMAALANAVLFNYEYDEIVQFAVTDY